MPQSIVAVNIHLVFSTKNRVLHLDDAIRNDLHHYVAASLAKRRYHVHVIASMDALGNRSTTVWNPLNLAVASIDPLGRTTTNLFNGNRAAIAGMDTVGWGRKWVLGDSEVLGAGGSAGTRCPGRLARERHWR